MLGLVVTNSVSGATLSTKQLGMNTFVSYYCESPSTWSADATTQMAQFKALGANSVALAFPLYMPSLTANTISAMNDCGKSYVSPSPSELATVVQAAHAAHLKVLIRPLLDETNLRKEAPQAWRGVIAPTSPSQWFTNYWTALQPYLAMSQQYGVERFAISTELSSMAKSFYWSPTVAQARAVYKGSLIFTASWKKDGGEVRHPGTSFALDTYQWVNGLKVTARPSQILAGWNRALATTNRVANIASATITEIGILAQNGAYSAPYAWSLPLATHPFNQAIQANWFTAACAFFKSHKMGGIYFWGSYLALNGGGLLKKPNPAQPSLVQPLSQKAIRVCFTGH
jgi:hypothetical protein